MQGFTFPVKELFLEDVLELTHYPIVADQGGYNGGGGGGGGGRRRKTQEKAQDPILEAFEVWLSLKRESHFSRILYHPEFVISSKSFPTCWICTSISVLWALR